MSPAAYPMPIQEGVRSLLSDLLGRGIDVQRARRPDYEPDEIVVVADYVNDSGDVATAIVVDHEFACLAGAALAMMPPTAALDNIRRAVLPDNVLENIHEVLNVAAQLMQMTGSPHVRLRTVTVLPGELPVDTDALVSRPTSRRDFVADIEGYGKGRM
jgi:hypothetical protein